MNFGQAIENLKQGKRVARKGWNGKGMFLLYAPPEKWIAIRTADENFVPWVALSTDILAEDWEVVDAANKDDKED